MNLNKNFFKENIKTIIYALLIAIFIRSIFFQPFYIPSSSMEPNLLIGDRLFVSKYSYGYSKHSFPFSPNLFSGRIMFKKPERGDVIVFKTPTDNRTDYIKRLIGLPGDKIQFINGNLFINNLEVSKTKIEEFQNFGLYVEKLPNSVSYKAIYDEKSDRWKDSDIYNIPEDHYFFLGDNRDNSKDSRYLFGPGYIHKNNLVGKAQLIFFSNDKKKGSLFKFWKWNHSVRTERFFKKIK